MIAPTRRLHVIVAFALAATAWACASRKPAPAPAPAPTPYRNPAVFTALPNSDVVSTELMALLRRGPTALAGESAILGDGPAPSDFPKGLLPPGAEVAATAVTESMTTVVAVAPDVAASDRRKESARLIAAGWANQGSTQRGFVTTLPDAVISVCRGTDFVSVRYVDRPTGGSFVRVGVTKDPRRSCVPRPDMGFADLDMPILIAPPGMRSITSGGGGGPDTFYSTARITTTEKPQVMAAHYIGQLEADGWKVEGRASEDDVLIVTRLSIRSKVGDVITAVLTATALQGSGSVQLILHIIRNRPSRGFVGGP